MNARLVCRPDSDWLLPQRVQEGRDPEAELAVTGESDVPSTNVAETVAPAVGANG
jgi:hypothetical protein